MKKLLITILTLFLTFNFGFAQSDSLEVAKTKSKSLINQLFMFSLAKDVMETRQLISDNVLGDSVENYMTHYDNALFFVSKLDYDFFWNDVIGRTKYRVPSSKTFLDTKESYISENGVNTSIDFDIVLTPQWQDPAKEDKVKDYKVKITPGNYTNLSFTDEQKADLNTAMNKVLIENANPLSPNKAKVNEAVFDGLEKLRDLCDSLKKPDIIGGAEVKKTKFEVININDDNRFDENDSSLCKKYPTYLTNNPVKEGSRWFYTSNGRSNSMKINITPSKSISRVFLHSKNNKLTLSKIKKESNPLTFDFVTTSNDTGIVVFTKQDSIKGKLLDGLNVISCKNKQFKISIYLLQDSSKSRPPNINFQDIKDYFVKIHGSINTNATFSLDTLKLNFSNVFDSDNDMKLDKETEASKLIGYSADTIPGYKVYIIDIKITKPGLAPDENIGGLARKNTRYPLINNYPVAIITTYMNPYVPSSVSHELGHLLFGLSDVFIDPKISGFNTFDDEFNIMDYVRPGSSIIYPDRKLRAYQVLEIENKTP